MIFKIQHNYYDIRHFIFYTGWNGPYKRGLIYKHDLVVKKLKRRDPNYKPIKGDKIAHVTTMVLEGGRTLSHGAEDPIYAYNNSIPLNIDYYLRSIYSNTKKLFQTAKTDFDLRTLRLFPPRIRIATSQTIARKLNEHQTWCFCGEEKEKYEKYCRICQYKIDNNLLDDFQEKIDKLRYEKHKYLYKKRAYIQKCNDCLKNLPVQCTCDNIECNAFFKEKHYDQLLKSINDIEESYKLVCSKRDIIDNVE
jgi:hypothetical protein